MPTELPSTLFMARGNAGAGWYRCALPAMALGVEWLGIDGIPPHHQFVTGLTRRRLDVADLTDYEVLIVQQPSGTAWTREIRRLQTAGIKVLFEIDDYVQAVRKMADHDFGHIFNKDVVRGYELNMKIADGVICSTEFLAERYRAHNPRTWVCRNGIDLRRYDVTPPPRETVNIGWAGATGHREAVQPWLAALGAILAEHPHTRVVTIGARVATDLKEEFGGERVLTLPFAPFETYPAAMTLFDVAIAPAGRNNFFRAKSDLRWLEASALQIPLVADPSVYPEIEPGITGFHATTPEEAYGHLSALVGDADLRRRVGAAALEYVTEHRRIETTRHDWTAVLQEVAAGAARAPPEMSLDAALTRIAALQSAFAPPPVVQAPAVATAAKSATADFASTLGAAQLAQSGPLPAARGTSSGSAALAAAQAEVGVAEQPPGSNDSPRIAQYRQATAGSGVGPWCAYFVSWATREAGTPLGDQGQGFGRVDDVYAWAQRTGRAIPNGSGVTPQPGDLIVWDEHIGIVESVLSDGRVQTVEGNSADKVSRRVHDGSGDGAIGYVRLG